MKIGGAILKETNSFALVRNIVQNYCSTPSVIVFSAFLNLSRKLREIAFHARNNGQNFVTNEFNSLKTKLVDLSTSLINSKKLLAENLSKLENLFTEFEKILFGISVTKELTPRTLDRVLSFGEYFSTVILSSYLKQHKIEAEFCDAKKIIKTDNNYGNANPIYEITYKEVYSQIIPFLEKSKLVFIQGFIGSTIDDVITTMGFESSNLTALLLSNILEAQEVIFWTDVEGIRSADPKIVERTKPIPELSFDDAEIASLNGLKLIHPAMIEYFRMRPTTKYNYRSAINPENGVTQIKPFSSTRPKMIIISEPMYFFENKVLESENFFDKIKFQLQTADYNCFSVESLEKLHNKASIINFITLLNFEPRNISEILQKYYHEVIITLILKESKVVKFVVENSNVNEIVNFIHKFI